MGYTLFRAQAGSNPLWSRLPAKPEVLTDRMTDDEFNSKLYYQISMNVVKSILEKGIIDTEMYNLIDAKMLERYQTIFGSLLSENWKIVRKELEREKGEK